MRIAFLYCLFFILSLMAFPSRLCAQIFLMDNSPALTCSGTFYDDGGPAGNYGNSQNLTKTFTSLSNQRLRFKFNQFASSTSDLLKIYDGTSANAPIINTLFTSLLATDSIVESTGSSLTFVWTTNASGTAPGWSAGISCFGQAITEYNMRDDSTVTACEGVFYDDGGQNGSYGNDLDYNQTFCSGTAGPFLLQFTFLQLEADDELKIYDGSNTSGTLLASYTRGSVAQPFITPNNCITFRFISNSLSLGNNAGWRAFFTCNNPTLPASASNFNISNGTRTVPCSGNFYDQGGPNQAYSELINPYTQTLRSANGSRLSFDFTSFSLEQGSDFLYIYDGPSRSYPLIGIYSNNSPPDFISTGDAVTFHFQGNGGNQGPSGWRATFTCAGPAFPEFSMGNQTISACTGRWFDPAGPENNTIAEGTTTQTFCAPQGKRLVFNFLPEYINTPTTYIGSPALTNEDSIYVYDGNSTASPLKAIQFGGANRAGFMGFEKIVSSGNCITFRFKKNSANPINWWASFTCEDFPEPELFLGKTGIRYIQAGNFTDDGGPERNYEMDIFNFVGGTTRIRSSIPGARIQASFSEFSTEANRDILQITNGSTVTDYSGNNSPGLVTSTGEELIFNWSTDASDVFSGWKATFSLLHNVPMVGTLNQAAYCQGSQMIFPFTSPTQSANNVFTAQLSDENGSFANPTNIGSAPGVSGGSLAATLPNGLITSGQYRIRILASESALVGLPSLPFGIRPAPAKPDSIFGTENLCAGTTRYAYSIGSVPFATSYNWTIPPDGTLWSGQGTNSIEVSWTTAGQKTISVSSVNSCEASVSESKIITVNAIQPLFASISSPTQTYACQATPVSFSSTVPASPGLTYQWRLNGNNIPGATQPVYIFNNPTANFNVSLQVTAPANSCFSNNTTTSNALSFIYAGITNVAVSIVANTTNICAGQSVVFNSNVTNLGTQGTLSWRINGNSFPGNTSGSFTRNDFSNGDQISLVVNSSALCANPLPAISDTITLVVNPVLALSASITSPSGSNQVCVGQSITLQANGVNVGPNPGYQWFRNGNTISGATASTYTTPSNLTGNQNFTVRVTGSASCISPQQINSPPFALTILSVQAPQAVGDTVCRQGVANLQAVGLGSEFRWYHSATGGSPIPGQITPLFVSPFLTATDTFFVSQVQSNCEGPRTPVLAYVNPFNNATFSASGPPIVLSANPANGQSYSWLQDGLPIPGANQNTYTPVQSGNYSVIIGLDNCTDTSAAQLIIITSNSQIETKSHWIIFPNPGQGKLMIEGNGLESIQLFDGLGRILLSEKWLGNSGKAFDFSHLPKGIYQVRLEGMGKRESKKWVLE
jgi:hypothetical protein